MIKFVVDSSGDNLSDVLVQYDKEHFPEICIENAPLTLYTDTMHFVDDANLNVSEMITSMENYSGRSYTSCPSADAWLSAFEGADEVFVITITSGLSGTYNSAMAARDIYLQDNPQAKVEVFDSLSTGPGMRLILEKLMENYKQGMSFEENTAVTREYCKHLATFFNLQSLHNLAENGRVNKIVAAAVGVLGISILGKASEIGTIEVISKNRGMKKVIASLVNEMEKAGYKGGKVRLCHVFNPEWSDAVIAAIKEKYGEIDVLVYPAGGLCSFYAERNGFIISCETA